jgi:hypothetical protein
MTAVVAVAVGIGAAPRLKVSGCLVGWVGASVATVGLSRQDVCWATDVCLPASALPVLVRRVCRYVSLQQRGKSVRLRTPGAHLD